MANQTPLQNKQFKNPMQTFRNVTKQEAYDMAGKAPKGTGMGPGRTKTSLGSGKKDVAGKQHGHPGQATGSMSGYPKGNSGSSRQGPSTLNDMM